METRHPIAECRGQLGKTQEEFGALLGVDGLTVSRWERCQSIPRRGLWPTLEKLGVPIDRVVAAARPVEAAE